MVCGMFGMWRPVKFYSDYGEPPRVPYNDLIPDEYWTVWGQVINVQHHDGKWYYYERLRDSDGQWYWKRDVQPNEV